MVASVAAGGGGGGIRHRAGQSLRVASASCQILLMGKILASTSHFNGSSNEFQAERASRKGVRVDGFVLVVRGPVRSGLSCEKTTKKRSVRVCVCWLEGYDVVAHQSSPNGRHVAPIVRVLVLGERDGKTTGSRKSSDHLWLGVGCNGRSLSACFGPCMLCL